MHLGGAVKAVMGAQNMGMGMGMQQPAMVPGMGTMGGVMPMAGQVRLGNPRSADFFLGSESGWTVAAADDGGHAHAAASDAGDASGGHAADGDAAWHGGRRRRHAHGQPVRLTRSLGNAFKNK